MEILHLTIKRQWFDEIATGAKTTEYREIKPYWTTRLEGRAFDEVHFRNGYQPDSPFMRVKYLGCLKKDLYEIQLGEVIEIKR